MLQLSDKQKEVWRNTILDSHRWNVSYGATRSGKTYLDYYKIPKRIRRASNAGLIALLGNTRSTLERNILEPMRNMYGSALVGDINSRNEVMLFGRKAYALGADRISQVSKIQGAGFSYVYGDEVTTWSPDVFDMLKSRLDKADSCFDGTCNPTAPTNWFKQFLDKDNLDIYAMGFNIDDNPFLTKKFVEELKKEYWGTVLYDRYILGEWVASEGAVYPLFATNPDKFIVDKLPDKKDVAFVTIGIDFGGNKSAHAFEATAFNKSLTGITTIAEGHIEGIITPEQLNNAFIDFVKKVASLKYPIVDIRADSAEQVLIAGFNMALPRNKLPYTVSNARKGAINERIRLYNVLMNRGDYYIYKDCKKLIEAFRTAIYDEKKLDDTRLDDGTTMIDPLDAQEYSTESYHSALLYGKI